MKLDKLNKNFLETNVRFMRALLIWAPDNKQGKLKRKLYWIGFWTVFLLTTCIVVSETIDLIINISDYVQTIRTLSILMLHIIYFYKVLSWLMDKKLAEFCIDILYRESYNFENFENFIIDYEQINEKTHLFVDTRFEENTPINLLTNTINLENFWMTNAKVVVKQENVNRKSVKMVQDEITSETNIYSTILIVTIANSIIAAICFIYGDSLYKVIQGLFFGKDDGNRLFPINLYVPFDFNNIKVYSSVTIYTTLLTIFFTMQYAGIDFFFWSMLIHMNGQIRVIKYALECITTTKTTTPDVTYICKMNLQFSKCLQELQHLVRLFNALKSMYSTPLLLQYLFVIVVSCCVLYSMTQEDNIVTAIGLMGFVACALTNSFFNIFYITQLTHKFAEVPNSIYAINWVGTNTKFQNQIIFAMAAAQHTIGIKMGNMIEVDLNVFVKILQTTYSFFTLLQTSNR